MKEELVGQKEFDSLILVLKEEYEYQRNRWNAKECSSGNCRLIGLAIEKIRLAENILSDIR
jgi:hypothetical protein